MQEGLNERSDKIIQFLKDKEKQLAEAAENKETDSIKKHLGGLKLKERKDDEDVEYDGDGEKQMLRDELREESRMKKRRDKNIF